MLFLLLLPVIEFNNNIDRLKIRLMYNNLPLKIMNKDIV